MNVLVTGAAGYIGSVVTERLIGQGHQVVAIDDLRHGHRDAVHPAARFVEGDLLDREWLMATVRQAGAEAVVHLAAEALIDESVRNPGLFFGVNVTGGLNLLDAMAAAGVRRLIFSSTAAVYGEPVAIPIREEAALAAGQRLRRVEAGVRARAAVVLPGLRHSSRLTALLQRLRRDRRAPASGTNPRRTSFRSLMDVALGRREAISLFGTDYDTPDGTCIRDYVHVLDIADAHLRCLERIDDDRADGVQPGQRARLLESRSHRRRRARDRAPGHGHRRAAPARRPGPPGGERRPDRARARVAAGDPRSRRDDCQRLGLAPRDRRGRRARGSGARAMIISRTPLRVSLVGGGSDLAAFYSEETGRGRDHRDPEVHLHHGQPEVRLAASAPATRSPKWSTRSSEVRHELIRE